MRKEILLAIIIGVIVGLGVTFGLYLLRERFRPNQTLEEIETSRSNNPTPSPTAEGTLKIQQPKNNFYTRDSTLRVVGRALPSSYITILTPNDEYITVADQDGDFSQEIQLAAGGNRLTVIATSPEGKQEEVVLSVVFSTATIDSPTATRSGAQP